ncbi:MAG TPA: class I SAM-dependent methyltransferase [Candidatus Polarisedimenticolaceae bacterium]|nr:class I SAM-dependent methyltransferase [Candidatus Polarisedimenticolaceae bacterium]
MSWQEAYLERFYPYSSWRRDGQRVFEALCAAVLPRGARLLEVGAGPSNATSRFLATLGELHGVDPDPTVRDNDALRSAAVLCAGSFPLESASFDGCVSNYVLEHLPDPQQHLREVRRVLRPGAPYVFRTPNRWHYVALVSRFTPHAFHRLVANRLRRLPPGSSDPYPTHYRLNSPRALRRHAAAAQLELERLELVEREPSYGMSSRLLFLLFTGYERAVNASPRLALLRSNIFGVLRRPVH